MGKLLTAALAEWLHGEFSKWKIWKWKKVKLPALHSPAGYQPWCYEKAVFIPAGMKITQVGIGNAAYFGSTLNFVVHPKMRLLHFYQAQRDWKQEPRTEVAWIQPEVLFPFSCFFSQSCFYAYSQGRESNCPASFMLLQEHLYAEKPRPGLN